LSCKDDFTENLTESAIIACESLGVSMIRNAKYRDSWCCIGIKGATKGTIQEAHNLAINSATPFIELEFPLTDLKTALPGILSSQHNENATEVDTFMPSNGRW
jgi:hypothetical protein